MNSERPDNDDDVAPEGAAAEDAGTTRDAENAEDAEDTAGSGEERGSVEGAVAGEAASEEARDEDEDGGRGEEPEDASTEDAREEGRDEGRDEGPGEGRDEAPGEGRDEAPGEGRDEAPGEGRDEGPGEGRDEGPGEGREKSLEEAAAVPEPTGDTSDTEVSGPEASPAEGPVRRRPAGVVVVSVAAAVLLVGGGGAYLATSAAGGSGGSGGGGTSGAAGDGTPPPLALDGYSGTEDTNGIAPGEPNPYGVTYRAAGSLPDGPDSAPVYRPEGEVGKTEVAELAGALGVDGTPVAEGQVWRVGVRDGSGPSLQVNRQAPGTWSFQRHASGGDACESTTVCAGTSTESGGDPVSEAAAEKAAAPVLRAVGQNDTKRDASQVAGTLRTVNADPVVDGLPSYGWTTGVTVNGQGEVVAGSGQLKSLDKGASYPVLSAAETLDLLNTASGSDHRVGIGGCASPAPLADRLESPCGSAATTSTEAKETKETITVEKAVFGLAAHTVDGRQALVPSWLFEARAAGAKGDFTVTYPAVDPEYLTSPTPSGDPDPDSASPSDGATSAPAGQGIQADGYTAEGRELTVAFTGGVCADYKVTVNENDDDDRVTVKVTETPWPDQICVKIAKVYHRTVQLDEPLGGRAVVGTDGDRIPLEKDGARLP